MQLRPLLLLTCLLALSPVARAAEPAAAPDPTAPRAEDLPPALDLARMPDDAVMAELLWGRSPDLVAARAKIVTARGDLVRAKLLPNPSLDASWNTIPVGKTNPPGLASPIDNVPNYAFSLSELVEIAKRGPRQRAARSALDAASFDAYELLRQRWYDLRERIAEVAAARVRVAALTDLQSDAHRLTELQRARAARGDTAGLDERSRRARGDQVRGQPERRAAEAVRGARLVCTRGRRAVPAVRGRVAGVGVPGERRRAAGIRATSKRGPTCDRSRRSSRAPRPRSSSPGTGASPTRRCAWATSATSSSPPATRRTACSPG